MSDTLILTIGTVIGAVVAGLVSFAVARTNASAAAETATLPPYEALAKRVGTLETDAMNADKAIQMLKGKLIEIAEDRDQLVEYVTEWFRWYHAGRVPPPPPVPMHLRDQLVWEEPSLIVDPPPPPDSDAE